MKREDPLESGAAVLLALGFMAFVVPMFGYEFFITGWLGSMERPMGLGALVVGGVLLVVAKLRQFRNSSPIVSPTDPSLVGAPSMAAADATSPASIPDVEPRDPSRS